MPNSLPVLASKEAQVPPQKPHIYLSAGGTGGHIFPAQTVARALKNHPVDITFLCDQKISDPSFSTIKLTIQRRTGPFYKRPFFIANLLWSIVQCLRLFLKKRPDLVVGFGGYPSFSAVFAAQILNIPTVLHEQNAYLGRTNRYLVKRAKHIALSFSETVLPDIAPVKKTVTGNPVHISSCAPYQQKKPWSRFTLVILGGSQGAAFFSRFLPESLALLSSKERSCFSMIQQCRKELFNETKDAYEKLGIQVVDDLLSFDNLSKESSVVLLQPFFEDVQALYERADLVIARSGASTVFELIRAGRAALLIPYPFASDDHQYCNALALKNACFLRKEKDITTEFFSFLLKNTLENPDILFEKAQSIHILDKQDATHNLVQLLLTFIPQHSHH